MFRIKNTLNIVNTAVKKNKTLSGFLAISLIAPIDKSNPMIATNIPIANKPNDPSDGNEAMTAPDKANIATAEIIANTFFISRN